MNGSMSLFYLEKKKKRGRIYIKLNFCLSLFSIEHMKTCGSLLQTIQSPFRIRRQFLFSTYRSNLQKIFSPNIYSKYVRAVHNLVKHDFSKE